MPQPDRNVVADDEGRPREKRHRSKSERSSRPDGHHKSRKSRSSKTKVSDAGSDVPSTLHSSSSSHRRRRHRDEDREREKRRPSSMVDTVPEVARTAMSSTERISIPYPSFSKAHSKESVLSREDLSAGYRKTDPLTPDHTDLGADDQKRSKSADFTASRKSSAAKDERPPSPPETEITAAKERSTTPESAIRKKPVLVERPKSRVSSVSGVTATRPTEEVSEISAPSGVSSQATATYAKSTTPRPPHPQDHLHVHPSAAGTGIERPASRSVHDPGITTVDEAEEDDSSPATIPDSSPRTPTRPPQFPVPPPPPPIFPPMKPGGPGNFSSTPMIIPSSTPGVVFGTPAPPPPPPPPLNFQEAPRVDYLLQNGGLPSPAPRNFLSVIPRQTSSRPPARPLVGAEVLFAPFFNLLEQYNTVLDKQGSVAVATGHRSVARRLLDRLEHVFSRDLPARGCSCIICETDGEDHHGLNWGEVLEWVSGRGDLPQWPPFDLAELGAKAVEPKPNAPHRPASPVNMDPDIAEEFRDHYLRQSKKVRHAVDKWLTNCAEAPAPPPTEVDDETLSFAILTNLDTEERPYFNALYTGARELQPAMRAPTPFRKPRTDFLVKIGLSLQRLYRLQQVPRDAETAMYLIRNRDTHDLLMTISDISPQEWEILTSGRFDGFLWSGADGDDAVTPTAESRGATPASGFFPSRNATPAGGFRTPGMPGSRMTTPFRPFSRGSMAGTPASFVSNASSAHPSRQPVSNDEEAEIAALAELEREIYTGMEALEDAFESLHRRAEEVRNAMRTRGAGLMQGMQSRRHINVYGGLPGSGNSLGSSFDGNLWTVNPSEDGTSESDWATDDIELMPDDSASNISSSRHRRPKRRHERRTPAPIEEDEEEY